MRIYVLATASKQRITRLRVYLDKKEAHENHQKCFSEYEYDRTSDAVSLVTFDISSDGKVTTPYLH